jgi:hypothetical protein
VVPVTRILYDVAVGVFGFIGFGRGNSPWRACFYLVWILLDFGFFGLILGAVCVDQVWICVISGSLRSCLGGVGEVKVRWKIDWEARQFSIIFGAHFPTCRGRSHGWVQQP